MLQFLIFIVHFTCLMELPIPTSLVDRSLLIQFHMETKGCFTIEGVTLAQMVKASVGQADVQRFEPHLGHNLLSCGVFLVKSRHFGLPLALTIRPNWQSLSAGGSVAIQTWSIYKVYT